MDRHDVRVFELGEDLRFLEIGFQVLGRGDPLWVRHLDRHGAVELIVMSQIDSTEAALSKQPDHPIATDLSRITERERGGITPNGRRSREFVRFLILIHDETVIVVDAARV